MLFVSMQFFFNSCVFSCSFVLQTADRHVSSYIAEWIEERYSYRAPQETQHVCVLGMKAAEWQVSCTYVDFRKTDAACVFCAVECLKTRRRNQRTLNTVSTSYIVFLSPYHRSVLLWQLKKWHFALLLVFQCMHTWCRLAGKKKNVQCAPSGYASSCRRVLRCCLPCSPLV